MRTKYKSPRTHLGVDVKNRECTDVPRPSVKERMPARVKLRDDGNYDIQVAGQHIWNIAPAQAKEIYDALGLTLDA